MTAGRAIGLHAVSSCTCVLFCMRMFCFAQFGNMLQQLLTIVPHMDIASTKYIDEDAKGVCSYVSTVSAHTLVLFLLIPWYCFCSCMSKYCFVSTGSAP